MFLAGKPFQVISSAHVSLSAGQWVQLLFNAKSLGTGSLSYNRFYIKYAVNIGYANILTSTFFCEKPPVFQAADLAHLW